MLLSGLLIGSAGAQEPRAVPFQGRLEGSTGPVLLDVELFSAASGGQRVWGPESQAATLDAGGRFSLEIGASALDECRPGGENLLGNPGFETGGLDGWTAVLGDWQVLPGDASVSAQEGDFFLSAGQYLGVGNETVLLLQDVDASAFSSAINVGGVQVGLSARVRTASVGDDAARLQLQFLDEFQLPLASLTSAPVSPGAVWEEVSVAGSAPPGTRTFRVRLIADHASGPDVDAFFDAIRVEPLPAAGAPLICGGLGDGLPDLDQLGPDPLWVELTVRDDAGSHPLSPRQPLFPVHHASTAAELAGGADLAQLAESVRDRLAPTGAVVFWPAPAGDVPAGWLPCDGQEYERAAFSELSGLIGDLYPGSTAETFRVPDYRGRFLRGVDLGAGLDLGAATRSPMFPGGSADGEGSLQAHATSPPVVPMRTTVAGAHVAEFGRAGPGQASSSASGVFGVGTGGFGTPVQDNSTFSPAHNDHALSGGDAESRPLNAGVHFLIKY